MAAATVAEVRARIGEIAAGIPAIKRVITEPECKLDPRTDLPAIVIAPRSAQRTREPMGLLVERDFAVLLLVQQVCKQDDMNVRNRALEAAEAWLDVLPDAFNARPRLHLQLESDAVAYATEPMRDSGVTFAPYGGEEYSAVVFTLSVTVMRSKR